MNDDNNLNVNLNLDEIKNLKKEYKKLKKYMKSNLYQIKTMDGTEKKISNLFFLFLQYDNPNE